MSALNSSQCYTVMQTSMRGVWENWEKMFSESEMERMIQSYREKYTEVWDDKRETHSQTTLIYCQGIDYKNVLPKNVASNVIKQSNWQSLRNQLFWFNLLWLTNWPAKNNFISSMRLLFNAINGRLFFEGPLPICLLEVD